jgi:putative endonuclease
MPISHQKKGYKILERNYRKPYGEIDIIAEKDGIIRFVEVKAVTVGKVGFSRENMVPEELVHTGKLRKLVRTASLYMEQHKDQREFQIDVVGVIMDMGSRKAKCRLFEQVLGEEL